MTTRNDARRGDPGAADHADRDTRHTALQFSECRDTIERRFETASGLVGEIARQGRVRTPEFDRARLEAHGLLKLRRRTACELSDCPRCGKDTG